MAMSTTDTAVPTALDLSWVRSQFPALAQTVHGHPAAFLDGPGGTQVPQRVIDAISGYLRRDNANTGGAYATSRRTDAMIAEARSAIADFLHCGADEVAFGPNMTTLTYAISRAIGRDLKPGDEIVVTRLDHDANVSPCPRRGRSPSAGPKSTTQTARSTWPTSPPKSTRRPSSSPSDTRPMQLAPSMRETQSS